MIAGVAVALPEPPAFGNGSGGVLSDDGVLFVAPSHTLEGLYHHAGEGGFTISNSLVFLLERLGATPAYDPHGGRRFASAVLGIEHYTRRLISTDRGPVERLLHGNLRWRPDGRSWRASWRSVPWLPAHWR